MKHSVLPPEYFGFTHDRLGEIPEVCASTGASAVVFRGMASETHDELLQMHRNNSDIWENTPKLQRALTLHLRSLGWDTESLLESQPSSAPNWPENVTRLVTPELILPFRKMHIPQFKGWHRDVLLTEGSSELKRPSVLRLPVGWLLSINLAAPVVFKVDACAAPQIELPEEIDIKLANEISMEGYLFRGPERQHIVHLNPGDVIAVKQPTHHAVMPQLRPIPGRRRAITMMREDIVSIPA